MILIAPKYSVSREAFCERKNPTESKIIAQDTIRINIPPSKDLKGYARGLKRDGGWKGYLSNAFLSRRNIMRKKEHARKNAINMIGGDTVIFDRTPTTNQAQLPRIVKKKISLEYR